MTNPEEEAEEAWPDDPFAAQVAPASVLWLVADGYLEPHER